MKISEDLSFPVYLMNHAGTGKGFKQELFADFDVINSKSEKYFFSFSTMTCLYDVPTDFVYLPLMTNRFNTLHCITNCDNENILLFDHFYKKKKYNLRIDIRNKYW